MSRHTKMTTRPSVQQEGPTEATLVHGRFEIIEELGRGSGGVVYIVQDRLRRTQVVLKHLWQNPEFENWQAQEAHNSFRILTRLQHPALPTLLDWGYDEERRAFYTKVFAKGTPGDKVAGSLPFKPFAAMVRTLADTLSLLHRAGYCHGDLKPHNLLIRQEENLVEASLIDFGLIFSTEDEIHGIRGTPLYLAPELLEGASPGPESDIYALGATLYHLAYGVPPFCKIGEQIGSSSDLDKVLLERIVQQKPQHPPEGWSLPEDLEERLAFDAVKSVIEDMMSPQAHKRQETIAALPDRLGRWTPEASREDFGIFVGRQQAQASIKSWIETNLTEPVGVAPLMLLQGAEGVGKRRLVDILSAELRSDGLPILDHTPTDEATDTLLDDLARQLLIAVPEVSDEHRTALLNELSVGKESPTQVQGGEDARRQRLLRHLLGGARQRPFVIVARGLSPTHPSLKSLVMLASHLGADRQRTKPVQVAVLAICTPSLDLEGKSTALSENDIGSLKRNSRVFNLAQLDAHEVGDFLQRTLPPRARPENLSEVMRLTGGSPLRLVEMSRALVDAVNRGQSPSGETLRRAADLEGELKRRVNRLSVTARAVLMALAQLGRPLTLAHLGTLLPSYKIKKSLVTELAQGGLLRRTPAGRSTLGSTEKAYTLESKALVKVVSEVRWEDIPTRQALIGGFVGLLEGLYTTRGETFENIELLQWASKVEQHELIARVGLEIGRTYRTQQRHRMARQALELAQESAESDLGGAFFDEVQQEALMRELVGLYLDLDEPSMADEMGLRLVGRWRAQGLFDDALLEAFVAPADEDGLLDLAWDERLGHIPGVPSISRPPMTATHEPVKILASLALAKGQSGEQNPALKRLWVLIPMLISVRAQEAWAPLMRALAAQLWRTSFRDDVLRASGRLISSAWVFEGGDMLFRSELLNLHGGLLEVSGRGSEAIEVYEDAMFTGRQLNAISPVVPKAMSNLARLMSREGEIPIARHYLDRAITLAASQGYLSIHHALLRTMAALQHRSGQPYSGLMTMEEAYRVSLSSGREDIISKVRISLIYHYGEFGLQNHAEELYEKAAASVTFKGRYEPHIQYAMALVEWGDNERARAILAAFEEAHGEVAQGILGTLSKHLVETEISLIEGKWRAAVRQAGQNLSMLKTNPKPDLKMSMLRCLIEAHLALGNLGEATKRAEDLEAMMRDHEPGIERPLILHLIAKVQQANGQHPEARRTYERAREVLDKFLSDMPEAYRKDFLRNWRRRAIIDDADVFLNAERNRSVDGLRQILSIVQKLHHSSERSLGELLSEVLDQMIKFTGAERGILFKIDPVEGEEDEPGEEAAGRVSRDWEAAEGQPEQWRVSVATARGFDQQDLDTQSAKASGTVIRRVLQHDAPITTADAIEDLRFSHSGSIAKLGMRSILAIPLRNNKNINGVVYLDSQEIKQFSDEDTELLDMLGDQMGPVVARAHHRAHVKVVSDMFPRIIGSSEPLLEVLDDASKIAGANVPVLVLGSTGTGKELLARGVHDASGRARGPFVAFNCATLTNNFAMADLFGAEKGAYTGAHQAREGYFEQANGGTLFLDEIGDMPLDAQAIVLRVLQEGVFRRLGGTRDRQVDVRIIAATHWDLEGRIGEGLFREDLFFRLSVVPLKLPDLRDRREDIPSLVHFFFNLFLEKHKLTLPPPSAEVIKALQEFPWPGNIRQIRNALQQAMLFSNGGELTLDAIRSAAGAVQDQGEPLEPALPEPPATPYGGMPGYPPGQQPYPVAPMPQGYSPQQSPWGWPQPPYPWPPQQPHPGWQPQVPWGYQPYPGVWPPVPGQPLAQPPVAAGQPGSAPPAPAPPAATAPEAVIEEASEDSAVLREELGNYSNAVSQHRYELVQKALRFTKGNKTKAAALMGITRPSLYRILNRGKG